MSIARAESENVFTEGEVELLNALRGDHWVIYNGTRYQVTVSSFFGEQIVLVASPYDADDQPVIDFSYDCSAKFFSAFSTSFSDAQAFLNGYQVVD